MQEQEVGGGEAAAESELRACTNKNDNVTSPVGHMSKGRNYRFFVSIFVVSSRRTRLINVIIHSVRNTLSEPAVKHGNITAVGSRFAAFASLGVRAATTISKILSPEEASASHKVCHVESVFW